MNVIRYTARSIAACLVGVSTLPMALPQIKQAETPQSIVLVELFTSEGCSSCPPADELLRRVNERQTAAGQLIVGISEHVTYWNRLGWTDPFSASTYTDRQERYASHFRLDSAYTPQIVVNGEHEFVGSDAGMLERAFASQLKRKKINLQIVSSEASKGGIAIHFTATELLSSHPLDVVAVITDDLDSSKVLRGENGGRSLQHVAVARSLTTVAAIHQNTDMTVTVPFHSFDGITKEAGHHLILFAQEPGLGAVVGVDAKPLSLTTTR